MNCLQIAKIQALIFYIERLNYFNPEPKHRMCLTWTEGRRDMQRKLDCDRSEFEQLIQQMVDQGRAEIEHRAGQVWLVVNEKGNPANGN